MNSNTNFIHMTPPTNSVFPRCKTVHKVVTLVCGGILTIGGLIYMFISLYYNRHELTCEGGEEKNCTDLSNKAFFTLSNYNKTCISKIDDGSCRHFSYYIADNLSYKWNSTFQHKNIIVTIIGYDQPVADALLSAIITSSPFASNQLMVRDKNDLTRYELIPENSNGTFTDEQYNFITRHIYVSDSSIVDNCTAPKVCCLFFSNTLGCKSLPCYLGEISHWEIGLNESCL